MKKISPIIAIIFIINIMIGSGIFLNTIYLETVAPGWSFLAYAFVAFMIFPLVVVCFRLLNLYPGLSLYDVGSRVHRLCGFIMAWGYFFGKLATVAIGLLISAKLLSPLIFSLPIIILAYFFLVMSVFLICYNMKFGQNVPILFFIAKSIPILCVFFAAFINYKKAAINLIQTAGSIPWASLISCVPFVIFSFAGFESFFAVASMVKDSARNASRVVMIGFLSVVSIYIFYQFSLVLIYGYSMAGFSTFDRFFYSVLDAILHIPWLYNLSIIAVCLSALGAGYGILYSNMWNLHGLAVNNCIPHSLFYCKVNSLGVPLPAIISAGIVVALYVIIGNSSLLILTQLSSLATFMVYVGCMISYFFSAKKDRYYSVISFFGITSCIFLLSGIIYSAIKLGAYGFLFYSAIVLIGLCIFFLRKNK